jgi:hypothetical protein
LILASLIFSSSNSNVTVQRMCFRMRRIVVATRHVLFHSVSSRRPHQRPSDSRSRPGVEPSSRGRAALARRPASQPRPATRRDAGPSHTGGSSRFF